MNIIDIINKKKLKQKLTYDEIKFAINGYINDSIKDYQMSSLLMAICLNGMDEEETLNLTDAMLKSGNIIDLSEIDGIIVDHHSTNGSGDKVSLILASILASLGIKVAKISDEAVLKLSSVDGFNGNLRKEDFVKQVNDINVAISNKIENLSFSCEKIYSLCNLTGTVESIPLIASSIMSKKIASCSDIIVMDVKVGNNALIKDNKSALELANLMCKIGKKYDKQVVCVLSSMDYPIGNAIGNSLEVIECINFLRGSCPSDLLELVICFASLIVAPFKKISIDEARDLVFDQINSLKAYNKFVELIEYQKGDMDNITVSNRVFSIQSTKKGYINKINTLSLSAIASKIGALAKGEKDNTNHKVGIVLSRKVGDFVNVGDELLKVYLDQVDISISEIFACFEIDEELKEKESLIIDIVK